MYGPIVNANLIVLLPAMNEAITGTLIVCRLRVYEPTESINSFHPFSHEFTSIWSPMFGSETCRKTRPNAGDGKYDSLSLGLKPTVLKFMPP
jgi:hypothetical protein